MSHKDHVVPVGLAPVMLSPLKVLRALFALALFFCVCCASAPEPYRIHRVCNSSCPGLVESQTLVARTEIPGRAPPGCVIGFEYSLSRQDPFRLWITDTGSQEETAYVDVLHESGEITSHSIPLHDEWANWFKLRCTDLLGPLHRQEQSAKCRSNIRDGNWIHIAQMSEMKWIEGESHGPAPDSELYELQEAALALIAATTASPDMKKAHLVRLHLITSAIERNPVPGIPRGETCRSMTEKEYRKDEKKKERTFARACKDRRKKDESPTFARECEQRRKN